MERFGEKLRKLRQREGISLRQLAAMLGHSSHSFVTSLERNERKPSAELVVKIADIFGVTTDQLLRDELDVN
ncbi:MAG: helix-turn-helix domain-containing protein [Aliifodinibius sp.]|nr:helix-turn-helix transcriptional regulator [Fodinibius sp.]NIY30599.1 helix-turn-helix domain-containing protein [Fodinibius sp.]